MLLWELSSGEPLKSYSCLGLASGGKLDLILLDLGPLFFVIAYEHSLFSFEQREHLGSSPSHRTFRNRQSSQALLERLRLQARGSSTMKSNDMSLSGRMLKYFGYCVVFCKLLCFKLSMWRMNFSQI